MPPILENLKTIAMHAVADRHDTGPMVPEALRATDITRQREPSHTRGFDALVTTQNRGDVHDTADGADGASELARTLNRHREPVQIATRAGRARQRGTPG